MEIIRFNYGSNMLFEYWFVDWKYFHGFSSAHCCCCHFLTVNRFFFLFSSRRKIKSYSELNVFNGELFVFSNCLQLWLMFLFYFSSYSSRKDKNKSSFQTQNDKYWLCRKKYYSVLYCVLLVFLIISFG